MAFTEEDLRNIEKAMASGERRVKIADKEVEYRSLSEMLTMYKLIQKVLNPAASPTGGRALASVGKGLK